MKQQRHIVILAFIIIFSSSKLFAQDSSGTCKVELKELVGTYTGECKNGLANGKGEAKGAHRYIGIFKRGLPNGKGTYYYSDNEYYTGNLQDGLREGKGEMFYRESGKADSVVKGYWSGDEYRGKSYKTYNIIETAVFDRFDLEPSDKSGNLITIETTATLNLFGVRELIATDGSFVRKIKSFSTKFSSTTTYELNKFPIKIMIYFTNGQEVQMELYKKADWDMRVYMNK